MIIHSAGIGRRNFSSSRCGRFFLVFNKIQLSQTMSPRRTAPAADHPAMATGEENGEKEEEDDVVLLLPL